MVLYIIRWYSEVQDSKSRKRQAGRCEMSRIGTHPFATKHGAYVLLSSELVTLVPCIVFYVVLKGLT